MPAIHCSIVLLCLSREGESPTLKLRQMKEDESKKARPTRQDPFISSQRLFYHLPIAVASREVQWGYGYILKY